VSLYTNRHIKYRIRYNPADQAYKQVSDQSDVLLRHLLWSRVAYWAFDPMKDLVLEQIREGDLK